MVDHTSLFRYHFVTGSDDNSVRVWELRRRKCIYQLPAHTNLVSKIKFESTEMYVDIIM